MIDKSVQTEAIELRFPFGTIMMRAFIVNDATSYLFGLSLSGSERVPPHLVRIRLESKESLSDQINNFYLNGEDIELEFFEESNKSKILREIKLVKFGATATYGEIAKRTKLMHSSRQVGYICKTNPLPLIIPCHRIIPKSGDYGNYQGGKLMKKQLLDFESNFHLGENVRRGLQ